MTLLRLQLLNRNLPSGQDSITLKYYPRLHSGEQISDGVVMLAMAP